MEEQLQQQACALADCASLEERVATLTQLVGTVHAVHVGVIKPGTLLQAISCVLDSLPPPTTHLFSDLDHTPIQLVATIAAVASFDHAITTHLVVLSKLLLLLDTPSLSALAVPANPDAPLFGSSPGTGIQIEEVPSELPSDDDPSLCARLVLAGALYTPHPPLPTPWASQGTACAAGALLGHLAAGLDVGAEPTGLLTPAISMDQAQRERVPQLVLAVLPLALQQLRSTLLARGRGQGGGEGADAGAAPEPDAFQRYLAGTQLAWLLGQLDHSALSTAIPLALPYLLACLDDPSPPLQCCGCSALYHCATRGSADDIRWQGPLLLDRMKCLLSGCDARTWPAAVAASVAVVEAVEGSNPYGKGYSLILVQLLTEADRHASQSAWAAPLLRALPRLAPVLGLQLVPHFPSLLPLLMRCIAAPSYQLASSPQVDGLQAGKWPGQEEREEEGEEQGEPLAAGSEAAAAGSSLRVLALQALHAVVRHTWPRMPAHAEVLWRTLEGAGEESHRQPPGEDGSELAGRWVGKCAEALWYCGGQEFQQRVGAGRMAKLVPPQGAAAAI